jgi:hypothetical protein
MPTESNSINAATTGIVGNTGTAFTGTAATQYIVLVGGSTSSTLSNIAPSATSGVPLISAGSSANPSFGTAVVAGGGTGDTSFTVYAPICGGTTTTGALQSASTGISTSGYVLTSNGNAALPSFQAPSAASAVKLFAYVNSNVSNVTGDGTSYTIIFNSTVVDSASAFNTGTGVFTAPNTGYYFVSVMVGLNGFNGTHVGPFNLVNLPGGKFIDSGFSIIQPIGNISFSFSALVSLSATNTLSVSTQVGSSTKTISVAGDSSYYQTNLTIFQVA